MAGEADVTQEEREELRRLAREAPMHIRGSASMDPDFNWVSEAIGLVDNKWKTFFDYTDQTNVDQLLTKLREIVARPPFWVVPPEGGRAVPVDSDAGRAALAQHAKPETEGT